MSEPHILTVCLNPTVQKTVVLNSLQVNEVNRSVETRTDASGKGVNLSRVLLQLGEHVRHLTQAGGWNRELFLKLAAADGLEPDWVESGVEIRFCYTLIDRIGFTVTEIVEEGKPAGPGTEGSVLSCYTELLENARGVAISGSKAAGFSDGLFPEMVRRAASAGVPVILDYRGKDLLNSLPHRPRIIKPNFQEFVSTFFPEKAGIVAAGNPAGSGGSDHAAGDGGEVPAAVTDLRLEVMKKMLEIDREFGCRVVVTQGSKGVLYTDGKTTGVFPVRLVLPVNTVGSGDAFTAGFFSAHLSGKNVADSVSYGAECGRLNAQFLKPGTIRE